MNTAYISLRSNDIDYHSTDDRLKGNNKKNILNEKLIFKHNLQELKCVGGWHNGCYKVNTEGQMFFAQTRKVKLYFALWL